MAEPTPTPTRAQAQAAFLTALAAHLRVHDLVPVYVNTDGGLHVPRYADISALVGWFRSVRVSDLRVSLFDDYAAVHAYDTTIGGQPVPELWGTVPGLEKLLVEGGIGDLRDGLHLTLAELEHYATHATLPEAGAR